MARATHFCLVIVLVLFYVAHVLSAGGQPNGVLCYTCDSHFDKGCDSDYRHDRLIMNCTQFITDLNPNQLRCVRIVSNTDVRGEVVIRRCAVVGDCRYIAKHEKQSCYECAHDLCNDGK